MTVPDFDQMNSRGRYLKFAARCAYVVGQEAARNSHHRPITHLDQSSVAAYFR
jgi:hypothetical protein